MRLVSCRWVTNRLHDIIFQVIALIRKCLFTLTSRVPVEGKASVCLICMKYRIIILIIIIISLGQILLSYIANTSRTHASMHARMHMRTHTRTRTHTHTHTATAVKAIAIRWRPTVTARSAGDSASRWSLK